MRLWLSILLLAAIGGGARANVLGMHTMIQDNNEMTAQLDQAAALCGWGGWVKQLMYVQDGTEWSFDPKWVQFVNGARQRHLNVVARLHYVEIWNEPNLQGEWNGHPDAAEFVKVLMAGADGAREADPRCLIVFPGLAPTNGTPDGLNVDNLAFLQACYASTYRCPRDGKAFRDHFDILGSHPYALNHPATYNADKYSVIGYTWECGILNANGDSQKKVLLTECGYALGNRDDTSYPAVTEQSRADNMVIAFRDLWAKDTRVLGAMPYFLHAAERQSEAPFFWTHDDGSHTLQYDAVQALKPLLADVPGNLDPTYDPAARSIRSVTMADALRAAAVASGVSPTPLPNEVTVGDVDPPGAPDDAITLGDALHILRRAAGLEPAA